MPACAVDLDEMEADLGVAAVDQALRRYGGQRVGIPKSAHVPTSALASTLGVETAAWLAGRYGGEEVAFPSPQGRVASRRASLLLADVIEAGIDRPSRSANDIAADHGVTARRVQQLRQQLRKER